MRADRLLSLLLLLQTRGQMTALALAEELEVSLRTIYRDVDALAATGVPIYADRGPTGGYRLLEGYRTRLTGMTGDEAGALFLAGLPSAAAELGLGGVLAAAQLKLLAALPSPLREQAGRIQERFHLDAPGWFRDTEQTPYLTAVARAVWEQRAIRIHYRRAGSAGERRRILEPLGMVLKGGDWYLMARAEGQIRTYRIGRLLELETLEEQFERPIDFDLAAAWQTWARRFEESSYRSAATIRLGPRARAMLPYLAAPAVNRAVAAAATPTDSADWLTVTIPIESHEHAIGDLLKLGAEVEVVAPVELRARMAQTVRTLAGLYAED
ncbi:MAG TPA: WYL domain-containing protein [Thermomicrobiales bacterium]|jgi:predicted DNA-binding transcriptional regulator YafY